MPNQDILVANKVNFDVAGKSILTNVSLKVSSGKIVGVIGPNGAGKTSLLKILSGQLGSYANVSWKGKTLTDYDAISLAQQVAVVNQLNDSVLSLNLYQIVRMGLLPHKSLLSKHTSEEEKSIQKAISQVGLEDKTQQTFSSLSGGEQQRGLIARALVQKAALIILDEPVNHLDIYYQHQILKLLQSLAKTLDITVVMSLHDLNLAANYCDQVCLLDQGKMVADGSPQQVFTSKRLQQVFKIPCEIRTSNIPDSFRVDFYPPEFDQKEPIEIKGQPL